MEPIVLVHGGAGDITDARIPGKINGVKKAVVEGYKTLTMGGSSLDAVEKAVQIMELDENFNAGYGSVLNYDGNVEMEASIMRGEDLKAGCVTLITDIMHPISVARRVMTNTNHTFIGGTSAMKFAKDEGFEILPAGSLVTQNAIDALEAFKENQRKGLDTTFARTELARTELGEPGTVGAVAIDHLGNIAAATTTGGITGKIPGRIGDTPILGSGTYADNTIGGVSTTGHGETIMRWNLAQRILQKIHYEGVSAQVATETTVNDMTARLIGTAGAITIQKDGQIGIHYSSRRMAWAYLKEKVIHFGLDHGEHFTEPMPE